MRDNQPRVVLKHRSIAALLLVQLLNGGILSAQRYFFPIYATEALVLGAAGVSSLVALAQGVGMVAAVVGGGLTDLLGRKRTLAMGLAGFAVSSLAFLARAPWLVGCLWAISGAAISFASLGAQGYLIRATGPWRLGLVSAFYHWGFTIGGALGSPVAGWILDTLGYNDFAHVLIGCAAFNTLLAIGLLPEHQRIQVADQTGERAGALRDYIRIVGRPKVVQMGLLRFLPTCYYGLSMVLTPLLIFRVTGTKTSVAVYATISQVGAALAQFVTGRASDRIGPRIPTMVALTALAIGAAGQALYTQHGLGLFVFGCIGVAAAWALSTLMPVLVAQSAEPREHGRVLGSLSLLWNLGMVVGGLLGGALVSRGPGLPFGLATGLTATAVIVGRVFFDASTDEHGRGAEQPRLP